LAPSPLGFAPAGKRVAIAGAATRPPFAGAPWVGWGPAPLPWQRPIRAAPAFGLKACARLPRCARAGGRRSRPWAL